MKPDRLYSPSFKLRPSGTLTVSASGRYVVQNARRVVVWDTRERGWSSQFKLIPHESGLAISSDDSVIAVKSTSGEIVFADRSSGREVARTGPYRGVCEGASPRFLPGKPLLLDGDWDGVLRLFDARTAGVVSSFRFDGSYMITRIAATDAGGQLFVAVNAKHDQRGGSRLAVVNGETSLAALTEFRPTASAQARDGGWRRIEELAVHPTGDQIALALKGRTKDEPGTIELINLSTSESRMIPLSSTRHYVRGLAWSGKGLVCATIYENLYRPGETLVEQMTRLRATDNCHLCFFDDKSLEQVDRWNWIDAWTVAFAPGEQALVVASSGEPGAYIGTRDLMKAGLVSATRFPS